MFEYREVVVCDDCGKVYDIGWGVPVICEKCGNRILNCKNSMFDTSDQCGSDDDHGVIQTGFMEYHRIANSRTAIAKPTLKGWVFRNE